MELTVRTLRGSAHLVGLPDDITAEGLKLQFYSAYNASLQVPAPEQQNLVFEGRVLNDAQPLKAAGVSPGSTIVILQTVTAPKPAPPPCVPAPTAAEIRAAIFEEARRRGIEHKLRDEAPTPSHTSLGLPHDLLDMDNQLMGLIEALEGRLGLLRQGGRQGTGAGEAAALLAGASEGPSQQGQAAAAAAEAAEPEPDIQPPEPEAEHVNQICDMGFSDALSRKALLLHRNRVPEAVEWLLQHAEDADAGEPVTQEQLRQVYGTPPRRGAAAAGPRASAAAGSAAEGGDSAAAGQVASALRELHMSLLQAVGMDADTAEGVLDRRGAGLGQAGAAGLGEGQLAAVDPLAAFRRRLQQQLGDVGPNDDAADAAMSLSELFPMGALMNLGGGSHDEEEEDEHDGDEEEEEEEEEEEHGDDEEEGDDASGMHDGYGV